MRNRALKVGIAGLLIGVWVLGIAPVASAEHHFWKHLNTWCVSKPNPYTGGTLVAAKTRWVMGTTPHKKNNIKEMRLKTRLIPNKTTGHNLFSTWNTYKTPKAAINADGYNRSVPRVRTPFQNAYADWNVNIKLVWSRRGKRDWNREVTWSFNESFCQGVG